MFSLWRKARRDNSAASRLLGSTSLHFALHGWQRMYGLEGVMLRDWIAQVFWALILTGFAIGVINAVWRCFSCVLSRLSHSARLTETWCSTCKQ